MGLGEKIDDPCGSGQLVRRHRQHRADPDVAEFALAGVLVQVRVSLRIGLVEGTFLLCPRPRRHWISAHGTARRRRYVRVSHLIELAQNVFEQWCFLQRHMDTGLGRIGCSSVTGPAAVAAEVVARAARMSVVNPPIWCGLPRSFRPGTSRIYRRPRKPQPNHENLSSQVTDNLGGIPDECPCRRPVGYLAIRRMFSVDDKGGTGISGCLIVPNMPP